MFRGFHLLAHLSPEPQNLLAAKGQEEQAEEGPGAVAQLVHLCEVPGVCLCGCGFVVVGVVEGSRAAEACLRKLIIEDSAFTDSRVVSRVDLVRVEGSGPSKKYCSRLWALCAQNRPKALVAHVLNSNATP